MIICYNINIIVIGGGFMSKRKSFLMILVVVLILPFAFMLSGCSGNNNNDNNNQRSANQEWIVFDLQISHISSTEGEDSLFEASDFLQRVFLFYLEFHPYEL